jgi:transposase
MAIPLTCLNRDERRAAKVGLVAALNAGMTWRAAAESVGVMTSEATAYRLRRRARLEGNAACDDHRHGYAYKLPPAVRQWLTAYCQDHPHTPSHALQTLLRQQFDVVVSIGHLNAVRVDLGVRYVRPVQGKKR